MIWAGLPMDETSMPPEGNEEAVGRNSSWQPGSARYRLEMRTWNVQVPGMAATEQPAQPKLAGSHWW